MIVGRNSREYAIISLFSILNDVILPTHFKYHDANMMTKSILPVPFFFLNTLDVYLFCLTLVLFVNTRVIQFQLNFNYLNKWIVLCNMFSLSQSRSGPFLIQNKKYLTKNTSNI